MSIKSVVLAVSACVLIALPAAAQDVNQRANYGELSLTAGFANDPRVVDLQAGGDRAASDLSSSCTGFVTNAPDVRLHYDAGSLPLIISVDSSEDTTLIINAPDGTYYCDDDGGENGLNPAIRFDSPDSGRYEIWVGTFRSGSLEPARLHISELTSQ